MRRSTVRRTRITVATIALGLGIGLLSPTTLVPNAFAASGAAQQAFDMAIRYHHGHGVSKSLARAQQLYCEAARSGHAEAMFKIGWMYLNGRETTQNDAQGAAWMAAASRAGHPTAGNVLKMLGGVKTGQRPPLSQAVSGRQNRDRRRWRCVGRYRHVSPPPSATGRD